MNIDWQTLAAAGIVIMTLCIFLLKLTRGNKKASPCGHNCGCKKI